MKLILNIIINLALLNSISPGVALGLNYFQVPQTSAPATPPASQNLRFFNFPGSDHDRNQSQLRNKKRDNFPVNKGFRDKARQLIDQSKPALRSLKQFVEEIAEDIKKWSSQQSMRQNQAHRQKRARQKNHSDRNQQSDKRNEHFHFFKVDQSPESHTQQMPAPKKQPDSRIEPATAKRLAAAVLLATAGAATIANGVATWNTGVNPGQIKQGIENNLTLLSPHLVYQASVPGQEGEEVILRAGMQTHPLSEDDFKNENYLKLRNVVIGVEDRHFWKNRQGWVPLFRHLRWKGIIRAFVTGNGGGSGVEQQLARTLFPNTVMGKGISGKGVEVHRKVREAEVAKQISKVFDSYPDGASDLANLYMQTADLGVAQGFRAAAAILNQSNEVNRGKFEWGNLDGASMLALAQIPQLPNLRLSNSKALYTAVKNKLSSYQWMIDEGIFTPEEWTQIVDEVNRRLEESEYVNNTSEPEIISVLDRATQIGPHVTSKEIGDLRERGILGENDFRATVNLTINPELQSFVHSNLYGKQAAALFTNENGEVLAEHGGPLAFSLVDHEYGRRSAASISKLAVAATWLLYNPQVNANTPIDVANEYGYLRGNIGIHKITEYRSACTATTMSITQAMKYSCNRFFVALSHKQSGQYQGYSSDKGFYQIVDFLKSAGVNKRAILRQKASLDPNLALNLPLTLEEVHKMTNFLTTGNVVKPKVIESVESRKSHDRPGEILYEDDESPISKDFRLEGDQEGTLAYSHMLKQMQKILAAPAETGGTLHRLKRSLNASSAAREFFDLSTLQGKTGSSFGGANGWVTFRVESKRGPILVTLWQGDIQNRNVRASSRRAMDMTAKILIDYANKDAEKFPSQTFRF